jgi:hypothetical protein
MQGGFRFSSLSVAFAFEINAFQIRRSQAAFHGSSSSGSRGTLTITIKASPTTDVDCSHNVSVAFPPTLTALIDAVICFVAVLARWAFLRGMSWVNHLNLDP